MPTVLLSDFLGSEFGYVCFLWLSLLVRLRQSLEMQGLDWFVLRKTGLLYQSWSKCRTILKARCYRMLFLEVSALGESILVLQPVIFWLFFAILGRFTIAEEPCWRDSTVNSEGGPQPLTWYSELMTHLQYLDLAQSSWPRWLCPRLQWWYWSAYCRVRILASARHPLIYIVHRTQKRLL